MRNVHTVSLGLITCLLIAIAAPVSGFAQTKVIPHQLVRIWDPITIFFTRDVRPVEGEVASLPEDLVKIRPHISGAYEWIDARTLQFRPASPWPVGQHLEVVADGRAVKLPVALEPPVKTLPATGVTTTSELREVELEFPHPVTADLIADRLTIRLTGRGQDSFDAAQWQDSAFFVVKVLSTKGRNTRLSVQFESPIPSATHLDLALQLTSKKEGPKWTSRMTTPREFRVVGIGCSNKRWPVPRDGVTFSKSSALTCETDRREVGIEFASLPNALTGDDAEAKVLGELLTIRPAVEGLSVTIADRLAVVSGAFADGTVYELNVNHTQIEDTSGRQLEPVGPTKAYVQFPVRTPALTLLAGSGVVELHGPKQIPLAVRAQKNIDIRVHRIDPLDRRFWPFPQSPVETSDLMRPPGPGELSSDEPRPSVRLEPAQLGANILSLGSPQSSSVELLPNVVRGASARFGLDLRSSLEPFGEAKTPGSYLVGVRDTGRTAVRQWIRIQVTDLALTAVRRDNGVRLAVTSLATGEPLVGARIQVQGWRTSKQKKLSIFLDARTGKDGTLDWIPDDPTGGGIARIVVRLKDDVLVIDPERGQEQFFNNHWANAREPWFDWTRRANERAVPSATALCHLFSERPVYKPSDVTHLKGWARRRDAGEFEVVQGEGMLIVTGPGDVSYRYRLELDELGGFYHPFSEDSLPAGQYQANFELANGERCASVSFRREDYVLPQLEVRMHGADTVAIDTSFNVSMTAHYYSGGRAAERPVRWKVTQFPMDLGSGGLQGFVYDSVNTFSAGGPLRGESVVDITSNTDSSGASEITIDPASEPSGAPRRYVIEASVAADDGRTVTQTKTVNGIPAVRLGLALPRVVAGVEPVELKVVAQRPDGSLAGGQDVQVRLLQREWHAQLRLGSASSEHGRYVTEPVDRLVFKQNLVTRGGQPEQVQLPVMEPGVYITQVTTRDRLGRLQKLTQDFYVRGRSVQTWSQPPAKVVPVALDKDRYSPGDVAKLVVQSPYQNARALVVVERPRGNEYEWYDVVGGVANIDVAINDIDAPQLPVHVALFAGRSGAHLTNSRLDIGRPNTVAATVAIEVSPHEHELSIKLDSPDTARPGEVVPITLRLSNVDGEPVPGQVVLWLVDQAVLALGRERQLNPLPSFMRARAVTTQFRDTRNDLFGFLPLRENPGGGASALEEAALGDNVTIRRNFHPVPIFEPALNIDESGQTTIQVQLPDTLTNFKVRAKAVSGEVRFGFATGEMAIRLPVVAQPRLPRFIRPGDTFVAGASVRTVEGEPTEVTGVISLKGAASVESPKRHTLLTRGVSEALSWLVEVSEDATESVAVTVSASRDEDGIGDGFEVPIRVVESRSRVLQRRVMSIYPGVPTTLDAPSDSARLATAKRTLTLTTEPAALSVLSAVSTLADYPYACTEQRIAKVRAGLALSRVGEVFSLNAERERLLRGFDDTVSWLDAARDSRGLVAFWPGGRGYVSLTAWSLQLLVSAAEAGLSVPQTLYQELLSTLRQSVRSDFPALVEGSELAERSWALAALTDAGHGDPGYAFELAARATFFSLENLAQVIRILNDTSGAAKDQARQLNKLSQEAMETEITSKGERLIGLRAANSTSPLLLPSEVRTIAELLRTAIVVGDTARRNLLLKALTERARSNGWGDTNADASALEALADALTLSTLPEAISVSINDAQSAKELTLSGNRLLLREEVGFGQPVSVTYGVADDQPSAQSIAPTLMLMEQLDYSPATPAAQAKAISEGFVVQREWSAIDASGAISDRLSIDGVTELRLTPGDVTEERIEVVNPEARHHVAVLAPLAAGVEVMNPALATTGVMAQPSGRDSIEATYRELRDDHVVWFFDEMPAGTFSFHFRTRAVTEGTFTQPPAQTELMYNRAVFGRSPGAAVLVGAKTE